MLRVIQNRTRTDAFITVLLKVFSSISFFEHELPTLEKNAMSYCVAFTRDLYAIAVPYSRGGRSEAQHNKRLHPVLLNIFVSRLFNTRGRLGSKGRHGWTKMNTFRFRGKPWGDLGYKSNFYGTHQPCPHSGWTWKGHVGSTKSKSL